MKYDVAGCNNISLKFQRVLC